MKVQQGFLLFEDIGSPTAIRLSQIVKVTEVGSMLNLHLVNGDVATLVNQTLEDLLKLLTTC